MGGIQRDAAGRQVGAVLPGCCCCVGAGIRILEHAMLVHDAGPMFRYCRACLYGSCCLMGYVYCWLEFCNLLAACLAPRTSHHAVYRTTAPYTASHTTPHCLLYRTVPHHTHTAGTVL